MEIKKIILTGIRLKHKTTNENGQSAIDCGSLWQRFEKENYAERINGKLSNEVIAAYFDYDGDHTQPFSYFIGCKVEANAQVPEGMDRLIIPGGDYKKVIAKGKIPDCISNAWKEIWNSNIDRAYHTDFEVYDERSKDWNNAEVEIYLSLRPK